VHPEQISVLTVSKSKLVIHASMVLLPRKDRMMSLLVWSTAT
jgi:hypothetical protein